SHLVQRLPLPALWSGRLDRVDAACSEAEALPSSVHDWGEHSLARAASACAALARGDFERVESEASHAMQLVQRSGYPWAGPLFLPALARARTLRGAFLEAEDALATLAQPGAVFEEPGPSLEIAAYIYRLAVRAASESSLAERETLRQTIESLPPPQPDDASDAHALGVYCAPGAACHAL